MLTTICLSAFMLCVCVAFFNNVDLQSAKCIAVQFATQNTIQSLHSANTCNLSHIIHYDGDGQKMMRMLEDVSSCTTD